MWVVGIRLEMRELDVEMHRIWDIDILIIFVAGEGP